MKITNTMAFAIGGVLLVGTAMFISLHYKSQIEEQFGLRQMASLEKEITGLTTDITEKDADIVRKEDELATLKSLRKELEIERTDKQVKHDKIKTAIYYLNLSLGTDQEKTQ